MRVENRFSSRGRTLVLVLLAAVTAGIGWACRSSPRANDLSVEIRTEIEPCLELELAADLLDVEGNLHVHGTARAKGMRSNVQGRLEVIVRTAEGTEWARESASFRISRRFRGGTPSAEFDLGFEGLPPAGSVVLLRHLKVGSTAAAAED